MKKFLTVIICIVLIAGVIFCVNFCQKDNDIISENKSEEKIEINQPANDNNVVKPQVPDTKEYPIQTGTGIYHGKIDSSFIEVSVDGVNPQLRSCKLAPELAEKFSSLKLEPESIISFKFQDIDGQYVIKEIN